MTRRSHQQIGRTVAVLLGLGLLAQCATPAHADDRGDQNLVGLHHRSPLGRFSLFGDIGFGSVRGKSALPPSEGKLAFDVGVLYDLDGPFRIGLALNHFRFAQTIVELEFPREINDVTAFMRVDGPDRDIMPYAQFGGGVYFTEGGSPSNVMRVAIGIEIPVARNMFRIEGRLSSFAHGAYVELEEGGSGRQSSAGLVVGLRFPLSSDEDIKIPSREEQAERLRSTTLYVASEPERRELIAISDPDTLLEYVDRFWQRRDPFPEVPGNDARDEHRRRVAIADQELGEAGRGGWQSERGRTMIIFGQPDEVLWENKFERSFGRDPTSVGVAADTGTASALELWIYYRALSGTDGRQSFFLFKEDAVSRYQQIWTNVNGEFGFGQALPPLPDTISTSISAGTSLYD